MDRDRVIIGTALGRWATNCYVLGDRSRGRAVVIDPGEGGAEWVPRVLDDAGLTCEAILLTHGHVDHFWSVPELARRLDVPVLLHRDDRWLWEDPAAGLGAIPSGMLERYLGLRWDPPTDHLEELAGDATLLCAGFRIVARHTPGHTPGHVTYLAEGVADADIRFDSLAGPADADVLFSGDLIFAGSVGRTDFPRGDYATLLRSIVDTVLPLEDGTLILSGHGPHTTVGRERRTNPFVLEALRARV